MRGLGKLSHCQQAESCSSRNAHELLPLKLGCSAQTLENQCTACTLTAISADPECLIASFDLVKSVRSSLWIPSPGFHCSEPVLSTS